MKNNKLLTGIILAAVGLLFIILKGQVISIAATCIGVVLIVNGIMLILREDMTKGIAMIVVGVVIILFGWLFVTIALYILAVILIYFGVIDIINKFKVKIIFDDVIKKILYYLIPILYIVAGVCLLFNQGEAISFVFVLTGVILLINGVLTIIDASK